MAQNVVFIPHQVENIRILAGGAAAARNVSPRVGHLHITVDDLPWLWADYGQSNTVIRAGMPRGQHKVLIELVDPEGNLFAGQTMTFTAPGTALNRVNGSLPRRSTANTHEHDEATRSPVRRRLRLNEAR